MTDIQYIKAFQNNFTGNTIRQSWAFTTPERGYLFQPDNGTSVLLAEELVKEYINGYVSPELEFRLAQRGFTAVKGRSTFTTPDIPRPTFFMIDLTRACTNRCAYCFRQLEQTAFIADEMLERITEYIILYCRDSGLRNIPVQPWGGEPLLAWGKIMQIQDKLEKQGIIPRILIETNGVAVTKQIAQEAHRRGIKMSISIDGPEEIHDRQRKLYNGQGSFRQARQGLEILREYGYGHEVGCVCVITRNSLSYIREITEFLVSDLHFTRVKMNMVKDNPVMREKGLCLREQEIPDFERTLLQTVCDINRRGYSFGECNLIDRLHNLLTRRTINFCNSRGCQAGNRMLSFGMEGGIYPCDLTDEPGLRYGTVQDSRDPCQLLHHQSTHFFRRKKENTGCTDCPWKIFCGGGCTTVRLRGNPGCIDTADCIRNRTLYPLLIDLILNEPELIKSITANEIEIRL